MNTWFSIN